MTDPAALDQALQDLRWNDAVILILKDGRRVEGGYRYVDGVVHPDELPLEAITLGEIDDVLLRDGGIQGPE